MTSAPSPSHSDRLPCLDVWRGMVVVWMALDHANHFSGRHSFQEMRGVPRPDYDSVMAWFTRFITHYCAPSFVFLAGASVVLLAAARRARGVTETAINEHLLLRGIVLVVLEFSVVAWGWGMDHGGRVFQVIGCIGACLIAAPLLRYLPGVVAVALGLLLSLGHPLLANRDVFPWVTSLSTKWKQLLLEPGFGDPFVLYPILPWLAVFLLGIGFGKGLVHHRERTLRWLLWAGVAFLGLWLTLRLTDGFAAQVSAWTDGEVKRVGNLLPHMPRRGWMDFFLMCKYPPSTDFVAWTLGGAFLFAWAISSDSVARSRWFAPIRLFGSVAMIFYLAHLYTYRWLGEWLVDGKDAWLERGLPAAWLSWFLGLLILLPVCWLYLRLKQRWNAFPLTLL